LAALCVLVALSCAGALLLLDGGVGAVTSAFGAAWLFPAGEVCAGGLLPSLVTVLDFGLLFDWGLFDWKLLD
jgi:hypothetical protein